MRDLASRVYEGADVIDSRDVIKRTQELETAAADEPSDIGCAACGEGSFPDVMFPALCSECAEELARLRALAKECEGPNWQHGETLIADSYFEEYAQQLAEDIGAVPSDTAWPACHIDWSAAADALKMDYSSVTYGDTEYWIHS